MMVHLYVNGLKITSSANWPQVPRVGDHVTWERNPPSTLHGCSARVTRVVWSINDALSAHVYLKGAWT